MLKTAVIPKTKAGLLPHPETNNPVISTKPRTEPRPSQRGTFEQTENARENKTLITGAKIAIEILSQAFASNATARGLRVK